jgi:hypothetical protein
MNYWTVYDYLVNTVHEFMNAKNECLYNALVLTMSRECDRARMLDIRDSAQALIDLINDELGHRDDEATALYDDEI